jgi:hypothetical protein
MLVAVSPGMVALHLAITAVMWVAVTTNLCSQGPGFSPTMTQTVQGMHGGIAWALLVLAAVALWQASPFGSRSPMPASDANASPGRMPQPATPA